jgi:hypothetical protein
MAEIRKTGGPAFPTPEYYDERPTGVIDGMDLRDAFAVAALNCGWLVSLADRLEDGPSLFEQTEDDGLYMVPAAAMARRLADAAYLLAQSMIEARNSVLETDAAARRAMTQPAEVD